MSIEETQKSRKSDYGAFNHHTSAVDSIMKGLKITHDRNNKGKEYPEGFETALFYMVSKLVRLSTSPKHLDSAHDLSSYANLWEKEIERRS